jgi:lipoprotein NlpI
MIFNRHTRPISKLCTISLTRRYCAILSLFLNKRSLSTQEPKLWYGIGILYDRYGSLEHAEEAFSQVMRMEPTFDKANEIYFRLGIIYKQQQKFNQSLDVSFRMPSLRLVLICLSASSTSCRTRLAH